MILCSRGHLAMCRNNWGCHIWGGGAPGTWWVDTRDGVHRQCPECSTPESQPAPDAHSAEIDRQVSVARRLLLVNISRENVLISGEAAFGCISWP